MLSRIRMPTGTRDSIEIQPFEIPWRGPTITSPTPYYSDDNVKIYAIPVFPSPFFAPVAPRTASTSIEDSTAEPLGKRKRELSPEYPIKRVNTGKESDVTIRKSEVTKKTFSDSLLRELGEVDNKPEALEGEYAEEYRKAVIQVMFPATNINTTGEVTEVGREGRKGKKSARSAGGFIISALSMIISYFVSSDGGKPTIIVPENADVSELTSLEPSWI